MNSFYIKERMENAKERRNKLNIYLNSLFTIYLILIILSELIYLRKCESNISITLIVTTLTPLAIIQFFHDEPKTVLMLRYLRPIACLVILHRATIIIFRQTFTYFKPALLAEILDSDPDKYPYLLLAVTTACLALSILTISGSAIGLVSSIHYALTIVLVCIFKISEEQREIRISYNGIKSYIESIRFLISDMSIWAEILSISTLIYELFFTSDLDITKLNSLNYIESVLKELPDLISVHIVAIVVALKIVQALGLDQKQSMEIRDIEFYNDLFYTLKYYTSNRRPLTTFTIIAGLFISSATAPLLLIATQSFLISNDPLIHINFLDKLTITTFFLFYLPLVFHILPVQISVLQNFIEQNGLAGNTGPFSSRQPNIKSAIYKIIINNSQEALIGLIGIAIAYCFLFISIYILVFMIHIGIPDPNFFLLPVIV